MSVSKRINDRRLELRMTQAMLAKKSGLTEASVSQFINGKRTPVYQSLKKLAIALGVSTEYLFGREELDGQEEISEDPRLDEIAKDYSKLSEEDKTSLYEYFDFMRNKRLIDADKVEDESLW